MSASVPDGEISVFSDFDEELAFFKDVFVLADPTGELQRRCQITGAFGAGGFAVKKVEKPSPYHNVWLVVITRGPAAPIEDDHRLLCHIKQLLTQVGISVQKSNIAVQQNCMSIQISFFWPPPPAPARKKKAMPRRLLA